jgi:hypothetical protein
MKELELIKENRYITEINVGNDGGYCVLKLSPKSKLVAIIFSWGDGWDHVSASYSNRCLTWEEMCVVKNIFFNEDETVIQYHPAKVKYINNHPFTLHLWKPQNQEIPMPPEYMV